MCSLWFLTYNIPMPPREGLWFALLLRSSIVCNLGDKLTLRNVTDEHYKSSLIFFFFFFNRHCNPCALWPAQISWSILSRKVFTECRCQRHVKPRNQWLERSNFRHQVSPTSETTRANPSSGRWNYGREMSENFAESGDFHFTFGFFYMP